MTVSQYLDLPKIASIMEILAIIVQISKVYHKTPVLISRIIMVVFV